MSNSGTVERQSDSEKVFPKATVFVGISGFLQVNNVMVIISGQPYVMELYDIGSVRLAQKSVYCLPVPLDFGLGKTRGDTF